MNGYITTDISNSEQNKQKFLSVELSNDERNNKQDK